MKAEQQLKLLIGELHFQIALLRQELETEKEEKKNPPKEGSEE